MRGGVGLEHEDEMRRGCVRVHVDMEGWCVAVRHVRVHLHRHHRGRGSEGKTRGSNVGVYLSSRSCCV